MYIHVRNYHCYHCKPLLLLTPRRLPIKILEPIFQDKILSNDRESTVYKRNQAPTWSACSVGSGGVGGGREFRTPHSNVLIVETVVGTQSVMWTVNQPGLITDTEQVIKEDQTIPFTKHSTVLKHSIWTETQCMSFKHVRT